jgi:hypothetical protein
MIINTINKMRSTDPAGYITEMVKYFGFEYMFNRYYGIYRGIVIDNVDPENRGRCRVLIPAIGHQTVKDVPTGIYAIPCMNGLSVGDSNQMHGCFFPPDLGDQVFVAFEKGLTGNPIYLGGWIHASNETGSAVRTTDASIKGIRTKYGHYISFDDASGAIKIERGDASGEASGTVIKLEGPEISIVSQDGSSIIVTKDTVTTTSTDGSSSVIGVDKVSLTTSSGTLIEADGSEVTVSAKGNINIKSATKIALSAPQVDIGKGPVFEPMVMGQTFSTQYITHTHISAAPASPTTPQVGAPPAVQAGLSLGVRVSY